MRFLTDRDVSALVTVTQAAEAIEAGFRALADDKAAVQTRVRTPSRIGKLSVLGAVLEEEMVAGAKVYSTAPDGSFRFVVILFDPGRSRWLAAIEAGALTRIRTAATSLMTARMLARPDSEVLTLFGAGVQARIHALAFATGFPLTEIRLVHRRPASELVRDLRDQTRIDVRQVDEPEGAVAGAQLVVTATRSATPLFHGDALDAGVHVTSVGATLPTARELDDATIERADRVAVENKDQARYEAGNLIGAKIDWDRVDELTDLAAGRSPGRTGSDDITLFDSLGTGLADIAVAALCYRRALETGHGTELGSQAGPN